ncbi:hypothetical protein HDU84_006490 [Entophlyctis sp. JEL0112]|nr:hypothetical protein HDU84_006490 [Entophlyctis sp. JEL0112]
MLTVRPASNYPPDQQQQQLRRPPLQLPMQSMASAQNSSIPQSLCSLVIKSRWRLVSVIGKGAFGEVYLANDLSTGEQVAVKIESPLCKKQVLKLEIVVMRRLQGAKADFPLIGLKVFTRLSIYRHTCRLRSIHVAILVKHFEFPSDDN